MAIEKVLKWKNVETISAHWNQRKKYQDVVLLAFTIQKFSIFSKNKKKYTEIICVKYLTTNKDYILVLM